MSICRSVRHFEAKSGTYTIYYKNWLKFFLNPKSSREGACWVEEELGEVLLLPPTIVSPWISWLNRQLESQSADVKLRRVLLSVIAYSIRRFPTMYVLDISSMIKAIAPSPIEPTANSSPLFAATSLDRLLTSLPAHSNRHRGFFCAFHRCCS